MKVISVNGMKSSNKGFTLVEVLAVIVILGILAAIAVPSVIWMIKKSEADVCDMNRLEVERMYEMDLQLEGKEHSAIIFQEYLLDYEGEICPSGGIISYVDGVIKCSIHSDSIEDNDQPDDEGNEVPFL